MAKQPTYTPSVKALLSGNRVDSMHGHGGTKETKRKVKQEQKFNPRQRPQASGAHPAGYDRQWELSEQPSSGE